MNRKNLCAKKLKNPKENVYIILNYTCNNKGIFCSVSHKKQSASNHSKGFYLIQLERLSKDSKFTVYGLQYHGRANRRIDEIGTVKK